MRGVTEPRPVPPAGSGPAYLGRIVLQTPALRREVWEFSDTWQKRLAFLRLEARVVFDDDRAVFDLYRTPESPGFDLRRIAAVLRDARSYRVYSEVAGYGASVAGGGLRQRLPATAECGCTAILRIGYDSFVMGLFERGTVILQTGDRKPAPFALPRFRIVTDTSASPPAAVAVDYLLDDAGEEVILDRLLALAGGFLPAVPAVTLLPP